MQAWDIAITDEGPIPLEVNVAGNLFIPQLVSQKGILSDQFHEFVRSLRGLETPLHRAERAPLTAAVRAVAGPARQM